MTERTIDCYGQRRLLQEFKVEGWWTSFDLPEQEIIKLDQNHGAGESFHSEFKTNMDRDRRPSGKFATTALIMVPAGLT